ncbi:unnamed protein product [Linum trigynum]|uniref:Uncharacterized protein n=1 Tax=Linum trigynum TaxID=586398 RepID=A0AAV2CH78_9ROSI
MLISSLNIHLTSWSEGLFAQKTLQIDDNILCTYKNQALAACTDLKLDALAIIGGVKSNTDAAQLAETFAAAGCPTKVVSVPVTSNGDLKNQFVETNVNSQLISNMCADALSAEKLLMLPWSALFNLIPIWSFLVKR